MRKNVHEPEPKLTAEQKARYGDAYSVPDDEEYLAAHRAKDLEKFGKRLPANRRPPAQKETKPAK